MTLHYLISVYSVLYFILFDLISNPYQLYISCHDSILTAQVAVKNATTLELEEAVETAEENLNKAIVNGGSLIEYKDQYIRNIFEARDALEEATEALENHKKDIEFLKGIQSMWE